MSTAPSPNRSAERMLDILDCFRIRDNMMLVEIAKSAGLPISTTSRLVQTLEERGFLARDKSSKQFSLGGKVAELATAYTGGRFDLLRCVAAAPMEGLGRKHNETVRLFIRDGGHKLCIETVECDREVRHMLKVGERHDLFRGAVGLVLLAHMPALQRRSLLDGAGADIHEQIEKAITDGYAMSVGEREVGVVAISVPIFSAPGHVAAALALVGPSTRFLDGQITEKIQDTVACGLAISDKLMGTAVDEYRVSETA